jgi:FAD/FMN-containing dehydrogenase
VLADGTVLRMMNQAVKNNAGMDLKHLFIGSEGVLGVITRAVLKLHPLPAGVSTAFVATPDYASALRLLRHAQQRLAGQVSAFEILWNEYLATIVDTCRLRPPLGLEYPVYVLIDMQGGQPESDADRFQSMLEEAIGAGWILDGAIAQSVAEADAFWALRDGIADVLRDHAPTINFDVSVAVGSIGVCAELIPRACGHAGRICARCSSATSVTATCTWWCAPCRNRTNCRCRSRRRCTRSCAVSPARFPPNTASAR